MLQILKYLLYMLNLLHAESVVHYFGCHGGTANVLHPR